MIVCEGESEEVYFKAVRIQFRLTTTEVVIPRNNRGPAPISVVECAEEWEREGDGYDRIFCVFDRDGHESFERAREKLRALANRTKKPLPIREVISAPCFEVWVLLHFEQTDAPFANCQQVIDRIARHLVGYEKADAAVATRLLAVIDKALTNARWLAARSGLDGNPRTDVHVLIDHLRDVGAGP